MYGAMTAVDVPHHHSESLQAFQVCLGFSCILFYKKDVPLATIANPPKPILINLELKEFYFHHRRTVIFRYIAKL